MTQELTFNDLPEVVATLVSEISELIEAVKSLQKEKTSQEVDKLLSIQEAGELLSLTVPTMYNKVSKNEVPYMKRGKRLYFSKTDLMAYLKSGKNKLDAEIEQEVNNYLSRRGGIV